MHKPTIQSPEDASAASNVDPRSAALEEEGPDHVLEHAAHCCGPRSIDGAHVEWDTQSHKAIVTGGAALLERDSNRLPEGAKVNAELFRKLFWGATSFQDETLKFLEHADYKSPWWNPVVAGKAMFAYHFCDPDTRKTMPFFADNYFTGTWTPYNAISEGQRYFYLSVHAARRILRLGPSAPSVLFDMAGAYLGLSLHFFTDLTQPMHAANFANVLGEAGYDWLPLHTDTRHAKYEEYAEKKVQANYLTLANLPRLDKDDFTDETLARFADVTDLFLSVARYSKRIWVTELRELARSMSRLITTDWSGPKVDGVLDKTLKLAPARVAQLLTYWMRSAREDLGALGLQRRHFYTIVEPTLGDRLGQRDDSFIYRTHDAPDPRSKVFLEFDAEGYCTLATLGTPGERWAFNDVSRGVHPKTLQAYGPLTNASRFRYVPMNHSTAWLYTKERIAIGATAGDEVLTVDEAGGHVVRAWPKGGRARVPGTVETQIIRLHDEGPMTAQELQAIRTARPSFDVHMPWWGRVNETPRWTGWDPLDRPTVVPGGATALAATSRGSGLMDLFAVINQRLFMREWIGVWRDWVEVALPAGVVLGKALAAVSSTPERLDIFGLSNQRVYQALRARGRWEWHELGAPSNVTLEHLAVSSRGPGLLDLYGNDAGGAVYTCAFNHAHWSGWQRVRESGTVTKQFGVASCEQGQRDIIGVHAPNQVGWLQSTGSAFGFNKLSPNRVSDLKGALVTSWDTSCLAAIALDSTGLVGLSTNTGSGWAVWVLGGRSSGTLGGACAAVSWGPYRVDLFATDAGGQICQRTYQ